MQTYYFSTNSKVICHFFLFKSHNLYNSPYFGFLVKKFFLISFSVFLYLSTKKNQKKGKKCINEKKYFKTFSSDNNCKK